MPEIAGSPVAVPSVGSTDDAAAPQPPRVSAVITTYNSAEHVPGLLRRLADMPVVDEIVICDDASTDRTPALLKDGAARDPRIRLLLGSVNKGVAGARNEALAACRGEFVWFADPDDQWSPLLVEVLHQAVLASGADIAVGRAEQRPPGKSEGRVVDGIDRWTTRDRAATLEAVLTGEMHGYLWNKLLRRSVIPPEPFPATRSQSDFLGLIRTIQQSRSTVFVPDVVYTHIERAGSITRTAHDQVGNLQRCAAAVAAVLSDYEALGVYERPFTFFLAWFFALPAVNTPLRTGASPDLVRSGIRSALRVLSRMSPADHLYAARRSPWLEAQMLCLLLLRGTYPAAYRAVKTLRAWLRSGVRGLHGSGPGRERRCA